MSSLASKVYVGDLPRDTTEKDLERAFSYYGPLRNVWVARNPPGFAFIEYDDPRDADDAVRGLDGSTINGGRVRVEHSNGKVRPKPWMRGSRGPPRLRRPYDPSDRCYECGERGHYAYDCERNSRGRRRRRSYSRSRSRSYDRKRSYSRSRSRSHGRDRGRNHSRSRSPRSRSRDRTPKSDR